jgi:hypothetical protein
MFSYIINNPNNFVIENDYNIIPFGHRCSSAIVCKYANIRKMSLPFDWGLYFFPNTIQRILENNFIDFTNFVLDNDGAVRNYKYCFGSGHYSSNNDDNIAIFNRRINRFNDIMKQNKKIYFVYTNEDYLYNKSFREDKFNDQMFNEMLELENFLKKKYTNINYNILYFSFKHHQVPKNSNIINIVLHTTNVYDNEIYAPFEKLRKYCGEILTKIFNTELVPVLEYTNNTFNN